MKRLTAILPLLALLPIGLPADFSNSSAVLHPRYPGTGPFIIDIQGAWPSDCHPGEQKPVVESFDGRTVRIGFEIIVVHVTCNDTETPYRSLVDMSGAVRATKPDGDLLEILVEFQGADWQQTLELSCPGGQACTGDAGRERWPHPGIYHDSGRQNQGLLVARQNAAMAIFPLVYDTAGSSEWLFTGNLMVEDSFFAQILRPSGGSCLGCAPAESEPALTPIGHLSVLADRAGTLQVKVNDGLFAEYRALVFGYRTFSVGPDGGQTLVDLDGRWGISENRGTDPPLGDLTDFLPGVFDLELQDVVTADPALAPSGQVSYLVTAPTGAELGQLVCKGQTAVDGITNVCEFIDPTDAAEPLFVFRQEGPSNLAIEYARAVIAVGIPPGGLAVRLD